MRPPIEPLKQNFKENPQRPGTYDIEWIFEGKTDGQIEGHFDRISDRIGIKYFVLKPIRQLRFRHQGAAFGLESWSHGQKEIFTGLIPLPQMKPLYRCSTLNHFAQSLQIGKWHFFERIYWNTSKLFNDRF